MPGCLSAAGRLRLASEHYLELLELSAALVLLGLCSSDSSPPPVLLPLAYADSLVGCGLLETASDIKVPSPLLVSPVSQAAGLFMPARDDMNQLPCVLFLPVRACRSGLGWRSLWYRWKSSWVALSVFAAIHTSAPCSTTLPSPRVRHPTSASDPPCCFRCSPAT